MHVHPDPYFSGNISSNLHSAILDNNDYLSNEQTFFSGSREIIKLDFDCNNEENNVFVFVGLEFDKAIFKPLKGSTAEESEQALAEDKLGRLEAAGDGSVVVKLSEKRTRELESAGISSVEVREPSGINRTYTSFKFKTLSDRELELLITQTKTYVVFLKAKGDQNDGKTRETILNLEIKSRYLEIERAIRKSHPELKYLLEGLLKTSPYKIAMRMVEIWNHQKAIEEKRAQEKIQRTLEIKHIIILEEISKLELHKIIVKDEVVENDFKSEGLTKKNVKQENSRRITHVNRFIGIYNRLNT